MSNITYTGLVNGSEVTGVDLFTLIEIMANTPETDRIFCKGLNALRNNDILYTVDVKNENTKVQFYRMERLVGNKSPIVNKGLKLKRITASPEEIAFFMRDLELHARTIDGLGVIMSQVKFNAGDREKLAQLVRDN